MRMMVSEVWNLTSARPSIDGMNGRDPVATTNASALICSDPTSITLGAMNRAAPV